MDIDLDESPIIPYSLRRRYIYDTPSGHISITGKLAQLFCPGDFEGDRPVMPQKRCRVSEAPVSLFVFV